MKLLKKQSSITAFEQDLTEKRGKQGVLFQVTTTGFKVKDKALFLKRKGGSKVQVHRQGGACNSALNEPNDFKFCMQGAFVG